MSTPGSGYQALTTASGLVHRRDRALLRVFGRAPVQMLQGILTQSVPEAPRDGVGESRYGALLTPKGKMISDVKILWLGNSEEEGLALDLSASGLEAVREVFRRSLPPRFAKADDGGQYGLVTVAGPKAGEALSGWLGAAALPDGYRLHAGGPLSGGVLVARGLRQPSSWDLWVKAERVPEIVAELQALGVEPVGEEEWDVLRVEGGYPRFGVDMTDRTIPIEAGLEDVAFDHGKGCYTGQEVIVRIRHRGHVNRHLRFLRMGDWTAAGEGPDGVELYKAEDGKVVGSLTSAVMSPRFGETVGLGYVRREVEPPGAVRIGAPDGPEALVLEGPDA